MHLDRRGFLTLAGLGWLTPTAQLLARQAETADGPAGSVILLWLAGGPSQLETFDPHPDASASGGTKAIETAAKGVRLAAGYERLAEEMGSVALVRSMTSKEGDHERGTYMLKTGYRPDPTVVHPSIGAICCHELPSGATDVPRHISILPGRWPGRGGFLGGEYDAFQVDDPRGKLPDVSPIVPSERDARRALDLDVVDRAFGRRRAARVEATLHRQAVASARTMMTSEQLKAFDVSQEPAATLAEYGDSPFGRGCLAARRLIEVGVRCVEVTLDGWDSHVANHEIHRRLAAQLDPAFAALIRDLRRRDLLRKTVVLCCGEFGRTPRINPFGGRDHWTNGFSLALAGGGLRTGLAVGETDPEGVKDPVRPARVEDVHATILATLGLDPARENVAPLTGRPIKLSEGRVLHELLG
ncbi:DUF1501 domain-containing protein [Planctomyces sp. SH-PL62]|uniref:DUF1501 domain-containing protein n=1 Tax=Planctomyces sp. SH-PL62 TaxID=1636152 RepID=UPI00078CC9AE|nr:DUF1501 domain-containing protein [Planctomyces sp. SH-PL62]AMV37938.1 hypothetical protein VT85_10915 [Planctomyces sp. SH-PL62]